MIRTILWNLYRSARTAYRFFARPRTIGVRVMVRDATGAFLLVRHTYTPGWYFPGGKVEKRESLREAAAKELLEEVGVAVESLVLVDVFPNFRHLTFDHIALFEARVWTQGTPTQNGEIAEAAFFPPDALPPDTTPATRRRIEEVTQYLPRAERWT